MISAFIIRHMKKQGHEVDITSVITGPILSYVELWFVDDRDVPTFVTFPLEDAVLVAQRHQAPVRC